MSRLEIQARITAVTCSGYAHVIMRAFVTSRVVEDMRMWPYELRITAVTCSGYAHVIMGAFVTSGVVWYQM